MDTHRRFQVANVVLFVATLGHALLTWPPVDTAVLFGGGMVIAFVLEALTVRAGFLDHHLEPQLVGVPVIVLFAWPAVVYLFYRLALLAVPAGVQTAALAAVLATLSDVATDPVGVRDGLWRYPDSQLSNPRFYDVPWWNFTGWFVIVFVTALLPTLVAGV